MKTFEELLKYTSLTFEEKAEVIICNKCNGIGTYITEELVDYHKGDYETTRHICDKCKGDGRIVEHTRTIFIRPEKTVEHVPYNEYTDNKFLYNSINHKIKIDNRDNRRENLYPDLKQLSYENYDKMLTEIKITETLTNYEKTKSKHNT
jgi:hypothetical protein